MNSAQRLEKILFKVQSSKETKALKIFEDVFEVSGCLDVSSKLFMCTKQLENIKEALVESQYKFLETLFSCNTLTRDMQAEKRELTHYIASLHAMAHYMKNENIKEDDLVMLAQTVLELEELLSPLDLPSEHMEVIKRYVSEIHSAIADIHIGGVESFEHHIIIANGTVVLYNEAFKNEAISKKINEIFKNSTEIINNTQVWGGALGAIVGMLIAK